MGQARGRGTGRPRATDGRRFCAGYLAVIIGDLKSHPSIRVGLLCLSLLSANALAGESNVSGSRQHWSGLPIWGAEAAARGYELPLPFGIGITAYSARQPVNLQDLQLGHFPTNSCWLARSLKPPYSRRGWA